MRPLALLLATSALSAQQVLIWDTTHGVYLPSSYAPYSTNHDTMRMAMAGSGYTLQVVNGIRYTGQLDTASLLVLSVFSSWNSAYTAAEAAAADSFRNAGGDVLVFVDNSGCSNPNLDPVLNPWGYDGGLNMTGWVPTDSITADPFYASLFAGVNTVYLVAAGYIALPGAADPLFWYGVDPYAAGECVGLSTTLVIGDGNFKQDDFVGYNDNYQFVLNIFDWFASGPCDAVGVGAEEGMSGRGWNFNVSSGSRLTLAFKADSPGELTVRAFDPSGRLAAQPQRYNVSGSLQTSIPVTKAGVYLIEVVFRGERATQRAVLVP